VRRCLPASFEKGLPYQRRGAVRDLRADKDGQRLIASVNVTRPRPYHVFVEAYGPAELYVTERTPMGFVVQAMRGDSTAEFSYRIVAKRRGYEVNRLERAPWADASPGFEPGR